MNTDPRPEHDLLQRLVGRWKSEIAAVMAPDQPPATFQATETVRPVGRLWILCEALGEAPDGMAMNSIMTLGYDPARGRFVGTFIASPMVHLWLYDGALDEAGQVLTLETTGPSFTDPAVMLPYRDVITLEGPDRRSMRSYVQGEDGAWSAIMTARYRRVT